MTLFLSCALAAVVAWAVEEWFLRHRAEDEVKFLRERENR